MGGSEDREVVDEAGRTAYAQVSSWAELCDYNDRCVEGECGHPDTRFVMLAPEVGDEVAMVGAINAPRVVSLPLYNPEPGSRYLYVKTKHVAALRDRMVELNPRYLVTVLPQTPQTDSGSGVGMLRPAWFYRDVSCLLVREVIVPSGGYMDTPEGDRQLLLDHFRADRTLLRNLAGVTASMGGK
jgi:hypothetical protein